jgi:NADH:ubiquinone oxidoreductase subunit F (NADH-binding)
MTTDGAKAILAAAGAATPGHPVATGLPRLLPACFGGGATSLAAHLARHGPAPQPALTEPAALIDEVRRSGLTGRGGGAFPTARKLADVAARPGHHVVVVNGTEGEPASAKDKVLLATAPHLVLDGASVAALAVDASEIIVVAHAAVHEVVVTAVAERRAVGVDPVDIRVIPAAEGFVAGEASAVVQWAETGRPVPRLVPPRLAARGLGGRPTLVQNAETLAHLALISRYGAGWFRAAGTTSEPGSMLVTVIGAVQSPGVIEVEIGHPVEDLLAVAGGLAEPVAALLVGGYFGTWVPWPAVRRLPFSADGLAGAGATPGAGLIAALPASACGLTETARLATYLAAESAGQCGPCVFGLEAIASGLRDLAAGASSDLGLIRRWLGQVDGRGACHHPDGAARMVRSALETFAPEVAEHVGGWCTGTANTHILPVPTRSRS